MTDNDTENISHVAVGFRAESCVIFVGKGTGHITMEVTVEPVFR